MAKKGRKTIWRVFPIIIIFFWLFSGWQKSDTLSFWPQIQKAQAKATHCRKKPRSQPAKIAVKIINKGATSGTERAVKNLLAGQKQFKVAIGQGSGPDIDQTRIFFREEQFRLEAEVLTALLIQKEQIHAALQKASTSEEKSADIVIMLGKFKEAPPA